MAKGNFRACLAEMLVHERYSVVRFDPGTWTRSARLRWGGRRPYRSDQVGGEAKLITQAKCNGGMGGSADHPLSGGLGGNWKFW